MRKWLIGVLIIAVVVGLTSYKYLIDKKSFTLLPPNHEYINVIKYHPKLHKMIESKMYTGTQMQDLYNIINSSKVIPEGTPFHCTNSTVNDVAFDITVHYQNWSLNRTFYINFCGLMFDEKDGIPIGGEHRMGYYSYFQ